MNQVRNVHRWVAAVVVAALLAVGMARPPLYNEGGLEEAYGVLNAVGAVMFDDEDIANLTNTYLPMIIAQSDSIELMGMAWGRLMVDGYIEFDLGATVQGPWVRTPTGMDDMRTFRYGTYTYFVTLGEDGLVTVSWDWR